MKEVKLYETCLPRNWAAKCEENYFCKNKEENLNQFRWRIMRELDCGCLFIFI